MQAKNNTFLVMHLYLFHFIFFVQFYFRSSRSSHLILNKILFLFGSLFFHNNTYNHDAFALRIFYLSHFHFNWAFCLVSWCSSTIWTCILLLCTMHMNIFHFVSCVLLCRHFYVFHFDNMHVFNRIFTYIL